MQDCVCNFSEQKFVLRATGAQWQELLLPKVSHLRFWTQVTVAPDSHPTIKSCVPRITQLQKGPFSSRKGVGKRKKRRSRKEHGRE